MNQIQAVTNDVARMDTLVSRARHWSRVQPRKVCHTLLDAAGDAVSAMTYSALDKRACAIAAALLTLTPPRSRVALVFAGGPAFLEAYLGCIYAGCIAVPIPYPTKDNLERTGHLVDAMVVSADVAALLSDEQFERLLDVAGDRLGNVARLPMMNTGTFSGGDSAGVHPEELDGTLPAHIIFTSGSTSAAKGVVLGHQSIAHNLRYTADRWRFDRDARHLTFGAPYHSAGLMVGYLMSIFVGASSYSMNSDAFSADPLLFIRLIDRYRIRLTACGDSAIERAVAVLRHTSLERVNLTGWRTAVIGGEPLQQSTLQEFQCRLRGVGFSADRVMTAYGMTEAAGLITTTVPGVKPRSIAADLDALSRGRIVLVSEQSPRARSMVSSGTPSHGVSVAIVDPHTLVECAPGEVGELWYCSPSLFRNYFGKDDWVNENFTSRDGASRTGYFRSGDLAAVVDGELYIAGRLKESISIGVRRLFPMDIEGCAMTAHPELLHSTAFAFAGGDHAAKVVIAQEVPLHALHVTGELRSAVRRAITARFGDDVDLEVILVRPNSLPSVYTSAKKPRLRCRQQYLAGDLCTIDVG